MIEIQGLVKKFGERAVVDNLTLSVNKGKTFGLLGPNGAVAGGYNANSR